VIFTIEQGDEAPGIIDMAEVQYIGPDDFAVVGETIIMDDTVNHRLIVYEAGEYNREIPLEWNMDIKKIFFDGKQLRGVYEDLKETDYSKYVEVEFSFATGEIARSQILSSDSKILLEFYYDGSGTLCTEYLKISNERIVEEYGGGFVETMISCDTQTGIEICSNYSELDGCIYLSKYLKWESGEEELLYELEQGNACAEETIVFSSDQVSPCQLVCEKGIFEIRKLDEIKEEMVESEEIAFVDNWVSAYATCCGPAVSIVDVRERMETYKNLKWTFNSKRNADKSTTGNSANVLQPGWLAEISDGKDHNAYGIPYCWGGMHAEEFEGKINNGAYAGNVHGNREHGYISNTAGMDCSGYVSAVFKLPEKHGTSAFNGCCFTPVSSVQSCDILCKAGNHVIIITSHYTSRGVVYVSTYEENIQNGKVAVKTGQKLQSFLEEGYVLMRYKNLK